MSLYVLTIAMLCLRKIWMLPSGWCRDVSEAWKVLLKYVEYTSFVMSDTVPKLVMDSGRPCGRSVSLPPPGVAFMIANFKQHYVEKFLTPISFEGKSVPARFEHHFGPRGRITFLIKKSSNPAGSLSY